MTAYLLDTNVVSELTRDAPHPQVIVFLAGKNDVWLSAMVIHELAYGLQLLPPGRRSDRLRAMQSGIVSEYEDRILPLDRTAAEWQLASGRKRAASAASWTWVMRSSPGRLKPMASPSRHGTFRTSPASMSMSPTLGR